MKAFHKKIVISILVIVALYVYVSQKPTNYVSHSKEPKIGDRVKNNNPSCKHFESVGLVTGIESLKGDVGKTITYRVENTGETYCKGQVLEKTMDQLAPL
jgi:hypothetical protein